MTGISSSGDEKRHVEQTIKQHGGILLSDVPDHEVPCPTWLSPKHDGCEYFATTNAGVPVCHQRLPSVILVPGSMTSA